MDIAVPTVHGRTYTLSDIKVVAGGVQAKVTAEAFTPKIVTVSNDRIAEVKCVERFCRLELSLRNNNILRVTSYSRGAGKYAVELDLDEQTSDVRYDNINQSDALVGKWRHTRGGNDD